MYLIYYFMIIIYFLSIERHNYLAQRIKQLFSCINFFSLHMQKVHFFTNQLTADLIKCTRKTSRNVLSSRRKQRKKEKRQHAHITDSLLCSLVFLRKQFPLSIGARFVTAMNIYRQGNKDRQRVFNYENKTRRQFTVYDRVKRKTCRG